jgi:hypothetical protein
MILWLLLSAASELWQNCAWAWYVVGSPVLMLPCVDQKLMSVNKAYPTRKKNRALQSAATLSLVFDRVIMDRSKSPACANQRGIRLWSVDLF